MRLTIPWLAPYHPAIPDILVPAFTFAITDDAGGRFKIVNDEVQVANSNLLDYEDTTSHTITVRVTEDDSSQTSTQTFTINLNNLDDTDPTQPTLDNLTVDENAANDTVVGTLSSSDPDNIGTAFTFAITDDAGGRFKIVNDEVQVANSNLLDYDSSQTKHHIAYHYVVGSCHWRWFIDEVQTSTYKRSL